MPSMEQPESESPGFAILLGPRQITAVLVVAVSVAGILCSLSYVAGRSGSRGSAAAPPPPARTVTPSPKPSVPVRPPQTSVPVPSQALAANSDWQNGLPISGATYLQLMSVEPGVAEVMAEGLHSEGFDAITAAGVGSGVQRVLVGPIKDASLAGVRARLEARGLHPFIRRYPENPVPAEPSKTETPKADPATASP